MKKVLLGTIGPVALAIALSGAAYAGDVGDVSGTLTGGYAGGLNHGDNGLWGTTGTLQIPFNSVSWTDKMGFEVLGGYHKPDTGSGDFWTLGGAVYAGGDGGRVAGNYIYHGVTGGHISTYGGGGEWFATPAVTLAVRAGAATSTGSGGGYVGTQLEWYVQPNFALSAGIDYWSAGANITSGTFIAEWMPDDTLPVSIFAGYYHVNAGSGDSAIFGGIKLYLNEGASVTLVDRQRKGGNGYITQSPLYWDEI
jgi:hypothetical protein